MVTVSGQANLVIMIGNETGERIAVMCYFCMRACRTILFHSLVSFVYVFVCVCMCVRACACLSVCVCVSE